MTISFLLITYLTCQLVTGTQHCHNETGRCYWLGTGSVSWEAARTTCQSEGGNLAVMETEDLWDFVDNRFTFRYFTPF